MAVFVRARQQMWVGGRGGCSAESDPHRGDGGRVTAPHNIVLVIFTEVETFYQSQNL